MPKRDIVVGLDVGTTKTAVVIGELYRESQLHILGIGTAPSRGLRGGQVVDIMRTSEAIDEAALRAERAAGVRLEKVHIGIAGGHLESHSERAQLSLQRDEYRVYPRHINAVVRTAASVPLPEHREVVAVIPKTFTVDSMTSIADPRGLAGRSLEVDAHIVTGAANSMRNLEQCVDVARIGLEGRILQPLASAEACLTPEQRRDGVVLIDIGGGTTDVAVFFEEACWHISVIDIGGEMVTSDISRGLGLPRAVAEELKIQNSRIDPSAAEDDSVIEVPGFDRGAPIEVRRCDLAEVVEARMEEILVMAKDAIVRSGYYNLLPAGVVLTGGGSQIQGLTNLAARVMDTSAALGRPPAFYGLSEEVRQPEFSTGIGLVLAGLKTRVTGSWLQREPTGVNALIARAQGRFRTLLSPKPRWETET
ncbi:MAG: cell division protein FtsA [Chloroflexi bacterium]|nr:cell division protein FtsA [Chloroflexota bacterium]MCY3938211.1 cell division protein FtsA [Chloroflexota bacterium]